MKQGDEVLLSEVAAGRDESEFPDADTFVVDRNPNRHVSFGVGIHRCPGSHLARITFSEMITAVLDRMPDFHIDPDGVVDYPDWAMVGGLAAHAGDVHSQLPLTRDGGSLPQRGAGTARRGVPRVLHQGVPAHGGARRGGDGRVRSQPLACGRGARWTDDGRGSRSTAEGARASSISSSRPSARVPRWRPCRWSTRGSRRDCSPRAANRGRRCSAGLAVDAPPVAVLALQPAHDGVARLGAGRRGGRRSSSGIDDDELVVVEGEPDAPARVHDLGRAALADRSLRAGTRTVLGERS